MKKVLILQTAFIGDVVLATSLIAEVKKEYPDSEIHFLLRSGNQALLKENPKVSKVIIWDKKNGKYKNLIRLALAARKEKYDLVLNIQRFASSGVFLALCGAKTKIGFKNNPLSIFFNHRVKHEIPYYKNGKIQHEVQRNSLLLTSITNKVNLLPIRPELFFSDDEKTKVKSLIQTNSKDKPYIVLAPSSVWFTKQWHKEKWIQLSMKLSQDNFLYFIGGPDDKEYIDEIQKQIENSINICGQLSLTESAILMKDSRRVIVNDSAPLHLASSVNAKTTAIFCSTIKDFGYFPLSEDSTIIETSKQLECRPCGLHGKKECPKSHFDCSNKIDVDQVLNSI